MKYIAAFLVFWPLTAHAGWFSYDNYEDCLLGKMKGQAPSMYMTADKECKRQFGVEMSVPKSSVKWAFGWDGIETKITIEDAGEYEITSGVFRFSEKPCSEVKDIGDFGSESPIKFKNGVGAYTFSIREQQCAKIEELKGKYK